MAVHRITATRAGDAKLLCFRLPVAMSRAVPDGHHVFDAEFVDAGVLLTYVGPTSDPRARHAAEDTPEWAK